MIPYDNDLPPCFDPITWGYYNDSLTSDDEEEHDER